MADDFVSRLRLDYAPVMLRHLATPDEQSLRSAYELGRRAVGDTIGLLDVVRVHNEVFLDVHASSRDLPEADGTARAAAALLLELVAAYEMTQRGFMENRPGPR